MWKTKPVVVEVIQWTGDNLEEINQTFDMVWGGDDLEIGSFIKRGAYGNLEVLSESDFHAMHERVSEWEENI